VPAIEALAAKTKHLKEKLARLKSEMDKHPCTRDRCSPDPISRSL
jgi:hypothetical protein